MSSNHIFSPLFFLITKSENMKLGGWRVECGKRWGRGKNVMKIPFLDQLSGCGRENE